MTQYRIDFKAMTWETPAPGIRFKAYRQGARKLRLAEFTKRFVEADWCTKGHIGYILEGQMDVDFAGEIVKFGAGDGLVIPAGEEHKHKAKIVSDRVRMFLVEDV